MVKDHDGFLWVGTEAGLNRFNGYDFTVYKSLASDSTTIPSNVIFNMFVDRTGNLWIGTSVGLCRYEKKYNRFKRLYCRMPDGQKVYSADCLSFFQDSKENLWTTCISLGLLKYNKQDDCFEKIFPLENKLPKSGMVDMMEDADGMFWIVTHKYLFHYDPANRTFREFENKLHLEGNYAFQSGQIVKDDFDTNSLWFGTWGAGLVHFNKTTGKFISFPLEKSASRNLGNIVFDIHKRERNKWWVASNSGIIEFDPSKKTFGAILRDSLNEKSLVTIPRGIYRDNEGIVWIGSLGGLCNIHPAKQNFISQPLWANIPVQKCYYDEASEKIYGIRFYSNRSLVILDRKTNTEQTFKIPDADELRAEPFSILKDDDGLIWIGTTRGIYTFDEQKKKFSLFETSKSAQIPERNVYAGNSFKDSGGNIWFACNGKGLMKISAKDKTVRTFFHDEKERNSFPLIRVNRVIEGPGNTIYACDDFNGIVKMGIENEKIEFFNPNQEKYSLLMGAIDIVLDYKEQIWIATRNNGLVCLDKNKNTTAYVKDNSGNIIDEQQCITIDHSGKIWLAASNGIFRFDPDAKSFTQFNLKDGFPAGAISDPLYVLKNGKITFMYHKGLYCFDPAELIKTGKELYVHLTSFMVNGKATSFSSYIDQFDTISLGHTENNITVEYAATNFFNAQSTMYSYMLDGVDKGWSAPSRTRMLNFTQLAPGNYWLRIKAGESFPEKKLFIRIIPAWWQTALFKWSLLLVIVAVSIFVIRFFISFRYKQKIAQLEQQREIEQVRMRISRDIHDEIGSGLTKIKLMSRNLSRSKEESIIKETSTKISSASDELIKNLGEIVWTINPSNDTLENIFAFVRNYISKLFAENEEMKLKLDFTEPDEIPKGVNINPEIKRSLLLILKECLTNIFKHSQATEVIVSMKADSCMIELNVHDNGKGMQEERQNNFGNGISNMRRRADSVNAQFSISSGDDGTGMLLKIPLHAERKIPT